MTYTTAHGNAGSLTHSAKPEIEPASSWILVGFVSAVPQQELLPRRRHLTRSKWKGEPELGLEALFT